ncbi:MAG: hypothetical protein IPQ04_10725 [Saprospiraceae bacterium]|nr:hypothetical protein [Saprospiraceae bacterium]
MTGNVTNTRTYTVTVTGSNGCTSVDQVTVVVPVCGTIGGTVFFDTDNNNTQSVGEVSASGGAPTNLNTLTGGSGVIVTCIIQYKFKCSKYSNKYEWKLRLYEYSSWRLLCSI